MAKRVRHKRGDTSLVVLIVAPLAVLGVSYLVDAILGTKSVSFPGAPARLERFAAITSVFCLLELVVSAVILVRARRPVALISMTIYLLFIIGIALMFGTFRG